MWVLMSPYYLIYIFQPHTYTENGGLVFSGGFGYAMILLTVYGFYSIIKISFKAFEDEIQHI